MRFLFLLLSLVLQLNVSGYNINNPRENHAIKTLTSENTCSDGRSDVLSRYQGQYEDSETGLYYNRFRYYDPDSGSYLSQDPIGLAGNNPTLYSYVKDPNSWVDVFGLAPNLNTNTATGNFGVYEIRIEGELHKIGKADLDRVTLSSGKPTRLHQQLRKLQDANPKSIVTGEIVETYMGVTTKYAKEKETSRLDAHYKETGGDIPDGNKKSYKLTECH
jgi:RHS repeat-associated protein